MQQQGLTEQQALSRIYLCNSQGLLTKTSTKLQTFQKKFAKPDTIVESWGLNADKADLLAIVRSVKPSIIIGVSGQAEAISQEMIETMYQHCAHPIVLPLSNPTSRAEVLPENVIKWTQGHAIIATGSPFEMVEFSGQKYPIAQCNNSYIFPGVGLGVVASKAKQVTDNMFMAASVALANCSPWATGTGQDLLPALEDIRNVSLKIAEAVAKQAMDDQVANRIPDQALDKAMAANYWYPEYRQYRRTSA
jgi:malate dehydrogenase (oxaloacetate-decarboxylating)